MYIPTSVFEILRETWKRHLAVGVCCCLQTCNSVINMLVMGLVLGSSLMVISIMGNLFFSKVSPLYNVIIMKALKCKTLGACMAWQVMVSRQIAHDDSEVHSYCHY